MFLNGSSLKSLGVKWLIQATVAHEELGLESKENGLTFAVTLMFTFWNKSQRCYCSVGAVTAGDSAAFKQEQQRLSGSGLSFIFRSRVCTSLLLLRFSQLPNHLPPKAAPSGARKEKQEQVLSIKYELIDPGKIIVIRTTDTLLARRGKFRKIITLTFSFFSPLWVVYFSTLTIFKILPEAGTQRENIPAYKQGESFMEGT